MGTYRWWSAPSRWVNTKGAHTDDFTTVKIEVKIMDFTDQLISQTLHP
jgi:hypothetical protein